MNHIYIIPEIQNRSSTLLHKACSRQLSQRLFFWALFFTLNPLSARTIYEAEYYYDSRGMVTNLVESYDEGAAENRELEYDSLARLRSEEVGEYWVQYEYDHLGNRTRQTGPGSEQTYHYNTRNELLKIDLPNTTNTMIYDLNGSLIQKIAEASATVYEWDSRGRMRRVLTNQVEVFRAEYAGGLNRLRKTEGATGEIYRHDGATVIQEVDGSGSIKELVRGDRGASAVGGILYSADKEGTNAYTYNGVGSTVALIGEDGSVRIVTYDAFGNVLEGKEATEDERLANTKEFDASIGLYYHGSRYYDANLGRYISQDPARDGANHYIYANNAPFTYVDPTGLAYSPSEHGSAAGDASVDLALGALTWLGETLDRGKVPPWIPGLGAASAVAAWRANAGITARAASAAARRAALRASGGEAAVKAAFDAVDDVPVPSSGAGSLAAGGRASPAIVRNVGDDIPLPILEIGKKLQKTLREHPDEFCNRCGTYADEFYAYISWQNVDMTRVRNIELRPGIRVSPSINPKFVLPFMQEGGFSSWIPIRADQLSRYRPLDDMNPLAHVAYRMAMEKLTESSIEMPMSWYRFLQEQLERGILPFHNHATLLYVGKGRNYFLDPSLERLVLPVREASEHYTIHLPPNSKGDVELMKPNLRLLVR